MSESTITISRTVAASPERVFARVDRRRAARRVVVAPAGRDDVRRRRRAGGHYRIQPGDRGHRVGWLHRGRPPRRLVFTWNWEDDGEPDAVVEDTVVVTFEPAGEGDAGHRRPHSVAHEPDGGAEQGWNDVMEPAGGSTTRRVSRSSSRS